MPTISAHPVRLLALSGSTRRRSLVLRGIAEDLHAHLRRVPDVPDLAGAVDGVGRDLDRLARLADEVADALLAADGGLLARYGPLVANLRGLHVAWRIATRTGPPGGLTTAVLVGRAVDDARGVLDQGSPIAAFGRRGTDYLADVEQVRLDVLLVALGLRPSPPLAVGALISFRAWAELATWDERRRLALAGLHAASRVEDRAQNLAVTGLHRATSWLRDQLDWRSGRGDHGPVLVPPPLPLPRPVRSLARGTLDRVDAAADAVDAAVDALTPWD